MYWKRRFFENIAGTSETPHTMEISRSHGAFIYNEKGEAFLDFLSGFNVSNIGHSNPKIIAAIQNQAQHYLHTTVYGEHIQSPQIQLAKSLSNVLPESLSSCYFLSTGSEAIDAAIKLSRSYTNRSEILVCKNAYHGSTIGAESLRSDHQSRNVFYPLLPDIKFIEYGNPEDLNKISIRTAAVIMECFQAEAGVRIAEDGYFIKLREKCDRSDVLLIFDEIQTGMGRTGQLFAFQHTSIKPDILLLGKALGAGLPLAAVVSSSKILASFQSNPVLAYITTFGGNPLCCAAGFAALSLILEQNLCDRAVKNETLIMESLKHPWIKEIRGKGNFIGVELNHRINPREVIRLCYEQKLILDGFLFDERSIRIMPPLDIAEDDLRKGLEIIKSVLSSFE